MFYNFYCLSLELVLLKVIPKYFIPLDAIVNGTVFLISFPEYLLLVFGHMTDFCMLIMYLVNLLSLFTRSDMCFLQGVCVCVCVYCLDFLSTRSCHLQR